MIKAQSQNKYVSKSWNCRNAKMQTCRKHATAKCRSARICNIIPQTAGDTVNTFSKAIFRIVNSLKIPFSKVFTVYN